ncbi:stage 0 sporulation family protein, partial [candidate division KSB1 bacterium]
KKCRELSIKHNLVMKIIDAEYQFDHNKLTFYFTADGRIDFRELVKNLASIYKTRIELRQIGARDEAKRTGGCGVCGISKCCTACITEFSPITTQLAKEQSLTLNPLKLSGVCGKLKCCLMFEKEFYQEAKAKFPAIETIINTSKGTGKIEKIDIFNEAVSVRYDNDKIEKMSLIDVLNLLKNSPLSLK